MVKRLLVADDSPTIQKVVRLALAGEDVQIESVDRADEVVQRSISTNADLVLVDVSMPGLTGYQICEQLKAESSVRHPSVVLLVGTGDHLDESEAARVGCDGHLSKPFEMGELLSTVRRLLGLEEAQNNQAADLVSARTRESFLGSGSVLDVFGPIIAPRGPRIPEPEPEQAASPGGEGAREGPAAAVVLAPATPHVIPFPVPKASEAQAAPVELPDEILDAIAQRVIRQMSPEIIREVAWEVIPDLAEIAIRQYLEEHGVGR